MRNTIQLAPVMIVLGALFLSACSSSGAGGGSGTGRSADATSAAPSSKAAALAKSGGGGPATCKILTAADVQPLLTEKVTGVAVTTAAADPTGQSCTFDIASGTGITVTVLGGKNATTLYNSDVESLSHAVTVPGVGDKASRDADDNTSAISALGGGVYCSAAVSDPGDMPGLDRLYVANDHHSDIGDKAYSIVAAALGTLCNKIYGKGNTTPDLSGIAAIPATSPPAGGGLPTEFKIPTDGASPS